MRFPLRAAAAASALLCGSTWAQTASPSLAPSAPAQRVEVVGSSIKRTDFETAAPVSIISRQEIERSGASTVQELLQSQGFAGQQGFETQASSSFVTGASAVGLRGLSAGDTLVLLNGRRIAPFAAGQQNGDGAVAFVDLNALPLSAVEEIQVLKDGASAIYGADAIAGVMNIVTRRDYRGLDLGLRVGGYRESGGNETRATVVGGLGDIQQDGYSLLWAAELAQSDAIFFRDRKFFRTFDHRGKAPWMGDRRSAFSDFGNFSVDGGPFRTGTNCPAANLRAGACRYDFGPIEELAPEVSRQGSLLVGKLRLGAGLTGFAELALNRNVVESDSRAPAADTATDFFQVDAVRGLPVGRTRDLLIAALSSQVPAGLLTVPVGSTLDLRTRFTQYGPRSTRYTSNATRGLIGVQGSLGGWDWEAAYSDSRSRRHTLARNELRKDVLADLIVAGSANVFGQVKTGIDSARLVNWGLATSQLRIADLKASGELLRLPTGPLLAAVGAEHRREHIESATTEAARQGLIVGQANTDTNGDRSLSSAFAELSIPLWRKAEMQLALRHDRYSDFGTTTNPKIALKWQPHARLLLRGSWGSAFKAPTLFQLFESQSAGGFLELQDTVRCPITNAVEDCDGRLIEVRSGGSATVGIDLQPEKSKNLNLGLVFEPFDGTSLTLDYWRIRKSNAITQNGAQDSINANDPAIVLRNPAVNGVPGTIVRIVTSYFNAFSQEIAGIDLEVAQRFRINERHRFTASASLTYLTEFDETRDPLAPPANLLGNAAGAAPNPRVKGVASLRWDTGPWRSNLTANYLHGYAYAGAAQFDPGVNVALTRVPSHLTLDGQVAYTGLKGLTLRAGVRNLLNRDAPLMSFTAAGTSTADYDARGRFFYLSASYAIR
jgi:iron complex outermembrane recepter protein